MRRTPVGLRLFALRLELLFRTVAAVGDALFDERSRRFQEQDLPLDEVIFDRGVKLLLGDDAAVKKAA